MSYFFQVDDLLGKHSDLVEGFNEFLTQWESNGNVTTNFPINTKSNFFCPFYYF